MKKLFILSLCLAFAGLANAQIITNVNVGGYFNTNMPPTVGYYCNTTGLTLNIKMLNTQNGNTLDFGNFVQNNQGYNPTWGGYQGTQILPPITQYPAGTTFPAQIKFIVTDVASNQSDSSQQVTYTNIPSEFELRSANGGTYIQGMTEEIRVWGNYMPTDQYTAEIAPWGTTNYTTIGTYTFVGYGSVTLTQPGDYKIRITSPFGGYADSSDAPLHVLPTGPDFVTITHPSGGEVYYGGQPDTITFISNLNDLDTYYIIDQNDSIVWYDNLYLLYYPNIIGATRKGAYIMPDISCNACRFVIWNGTEPIQQGRADTSGVFSIHTKSISGRVYYDINSNGQYDTGDFPYGTPVVTATPANVGTVIAHNDGSYNFNTGTYSGPVTLTFNDNGVLCQHQLLPPSITATLDSVNISGQDFRIVPIINTTYEMSMAMYTTDVGIAWPWVRELTIYNSGGAVSPTATVTYSYNNSLEYYMPNYMLTETTPVSQTASSLTFDIPPILPCQSYTIFMYFQATAPANTVLIEGAYFNGYPNDGNINNNEASFNVLVHASYDPNDKTVNRDTIYAPQLPVTEPLYYTLRFQNTGTEPAYNIKLIDTLSTMFDITTLKTETASHTVEFYLRPDNVAEWRFPNIQLPDSTTDEALSHGYVIFSILPKNTLIVGDEIKNFVDIYFDYNEPVRTNTAITRILEPLSIKENAADLFSLMPNPANGMVQINLKEKANGKIALKLYSTDGKLLQTATHYLQNSTILMQDISTLVNGVYYVGITVNEKETVKKLVVIH